MCSLTVLQPEGSPSRLLLKLMGERGCTVGHLIDHLQTLGNAEALECLKPSGAETQRRLGAWQTRTKRQTECSRRRCSPADHRSAPVCGPHVWTQPAPHLLRCGQVAGAVPVVQDQRGGETPKLFRRAVTGFMLLFFFYQGYVILIFAQNPNFSFRQN